MLDHNTDDIASEILKVYLVRYPLTRYILGVLMHTTRAVGEGVAGVAIAPPVFRDFHLFSQKSAPKMLKIGLFCVFRPPSF